MPRTKFAKCMTRSCRKLVDDEQDYCWRCQLKFSVEPVEHKKFKPSTLAYEYNCLFCGYRDDRLRMADTMARMLAQSGLLRCPVCRKGGITLTEIIGEPVQLPAHSVGA
jgi:UDP-N-acetylglucosamine:LPS N-acetylglucosamine transferase